MLFRSLHTNSAPESIIRLLDMGMDPFNFADALLGILAQRLAKRLCAKCKEPHPATDDEIRALVEEYSLELLNTEPWKKDPQGEKTRLLESWVKEFGDNGRPLAKPWCEPEHPQAADSESRREGEKPIDKASHGGGTHHRQRD